MIGSSGLDPTAPTVRERDANESNHTSPDVVRAGVIGYGYWGPNIVRNLGALDGCEVAAICDKSPAALKRASRAYPGMQLTADCTDLLHKQNS
jgi:predicted homoserine dehydrogenase-like protein